MTNQEAYEKAALYLLQQNAKAVKIFVSADGMTSSAKCMYRGPRGLKCAVGVLIPDAEYKPEMENKTAMRIMMDAENLAPSLVGVDAHLLDDLQRVHDTEEVVDWPTSLITIGRRYGLSTDAVRACIEGSGLR